MVVVLGHISVKLDELSIHKEINQWLLSLIIENKQGMRSSLIAHLINTLSL